MAPSRASPLPHCNAYSCGSELDRDSILRRSMITEQVAQLKFPVPFWPYAPIAAIAFMLFVFGVLGYFPDTQAALVTPDPTFSHR